MCNGLFWSRGLCVVADWRECLLTEVVGVESGILGDGDADNGLLGFDGIEVRAYKEMRRSVAASVSSGCEGSCAGSGPGNQAARLGLVTLGGGGRYREEGKSMQREACVVSDPDDLDGHSLPVGWKGSLPLLAIKFTSWAQRDVSVHEWRAPT